MLRLGEISFINAFPLSQEAGLILNDPQTEAIDVTCAPPSQLNQHILNGELDVSPVSSAFYCRHRDELVLLPGPCIASTSPVKSVLFIAPSNWHDTNTSERIWIPDTSETSIVLLQWMLSHDNWGDIEYFVYEVGQAEGLSFKVRPFSPLAMKPSGLTRNLANAITTYKPK